MKLSSARLVAGAALVTAASIAAAPLDAARPKQAAYAPHIDPANFQAVVDHPYFPLVPGTKLKYVERHGKKTSENELTVLSETKVVQGVTCTVVRDVVRENGAIHEDTFDWYAQDRDGNVWYFGEDMKEFLPHGRVSTEGSWEAGVDGAHAGIIMKARPAVGEPYRQEYSPGNAEDMGQIVAVSVSAKVPYGSFSDCVKTKDWSLLEAGHEYKWYAKGIGFIRGESASREISELVSVTRP
jgi:hypothetical protein